MPNQILYKMNAVDQVCQYILIDLYSDTLCSKYGTSYEQTTK